MQADRNHPDMGRNGSRIPGGFRAAFADAIAGAGFTVKEWQGSSVICVDRAGEERTLSLGNVYRRCQNAERGEWPEIIGEFIRHMSEATKEAALPVRLEDAAEQLFVRIGVPFPKSMGDGTPWHRPVGDTGLVENMVIDHPHFMSYVSPKLIEESGKDGEYWLEVARGNLRDLTPGGYLTPVGDEGNILIGCANDAYDAARALILDGLLPEPPPHGCFVAVPTRDVLIIMPVDPHSLVHVHVLKRFAVDNYKSRPYPISDEVFWVRAGEWRRFPVEIVKDAVQITPPREFMEVLDELSPETDGDEA